MHENERKTELSSVSVVSDPIVLYTEVSAHCTHKCFFCGMTNVNRQGFLKDEVDQRIGVLLRANRDRRFLVYNHLIGEPLLYRGLEKRLPTILLPNTEVWVCTNGILLDEARIDSLLDAGLENIWFTLFGADREEYLKFSGVDLYDKALSSLDCLIDHLPRFRHARIACFSLAAPDIENRIKGMTHVKLEVSRSILPWTIEQPNPVRSICISINGDITYDWKDSNFTLSPGNILTMTNEEVMEGYFHPLPRLGLAAGR
jgi:hypothetical protein